MRVLKTIGYIVAIVAVIVGTSSSVLANDSQANSCSQTLCDLNTAMSLPSALLTLEKPSISTPDWMKLKATFTYSVETRGTITANLDEFKQQANETLNDARGWSRLDVGFKEVVSGGNFTLVLSEAAQVPSFSPDGCSTTYSCTVGRYVIINQDRWLGGTPSWNDAGGSLRDYRHMVINHETGHWLGHGHVFCSGPGQAAPVMQQQSIDLQGCRFNPWPLESELTTSRL